MRVWQKLVMADYSFDFKQAILFLWFEVLVVNVIVLHGLRDGRVW